MRHSHEVRQGHNGVWENNAYSYVSRIIVDVAWPDYVDYKGKRYYDYGKPATTKSGTPCNCYMYSGNGTTDERLWLDINGCIDED